MGTSPCPYGSAGGRRGPCWPTCEIPLSCEVPSSGYKNFAAARSRGGLATHVCGERAWPRSATGAKEVPSRSGSPQESQNLRAVIGCGWCQPQRPWWPRQTLPTEGAEQQRSNVLWDTPKWARRTEREHAGKQIRCEATVGGGPPGRPQVRSDCHGTEQ